MDCQRIVIANTPMYWKIYNVYRLKRNVYMLIHTNNTETVTNEDGQKPSLSSEGCATKTERLVSHKDTRIWSWTSGGAQHHDVYGWLTDWPTDRPPVVTWLWVFSSCLKSQACWSCDAMFKVDAIAFKVSSLVITCGGISTWTWRNYSNLPPLWIKYVYRYQLICAERLKTQHTGRLHSCECK
jgi:hypothetical protein